MQILVNRIIFLPVKSTDVFSVFIVWINLDFGIEVNFYNGMNAYSITVKHSCSLCSLILHTLIATVYLLDHLKYPTYNRSVWLYNANVKHFAW